MENSKKYLKGVLQGPTNGPRVTFLSLFVASRSSLWTEAHGIKPRVAYGEIGDSVGLLPGSGYFRCPLRYSCQLLKRFCQMA